MRPPHTPLQRFDRSQRGRRLIALEAKRKAGALSTLERARFRRLLNERRMIAEESSRTEECETCKAPRWEHSPEQWEYCERKAERARTVVRVPGNELVN